MSMAEYDILIFAEQQVVEWGAFVRAFYKFLKVRPPRGRRLCRRKQPTRYTFFLHKEMETIK